MELSFNKVWERDTSGGNIAFWVRGDHYALHISGTLDAASTDVVSPALDSILEQHPKELIFDLAELKYLTSMGYRLFLIALKSQNEHGGTVSFIHLQPQIQEVFSIMGALSDLNVFADVAELDHYLLARQKAVERGE
jgi:anti-sigma B factor antagonist